MSRHPGGELFDLYGTHESGRGRSCEHHACCGSILQIDTVIRLRKQQIINDEGREEAAIAAYWITDGVDRCRVGFMPRHFVPHAEMFDGKVAQVVELLEYSESKADRNRSYRNKGVVRIAILNEGPDTDAQLFTAAAAPVRQRKTLSPILGKFDTDDDSDSIMPKMPTDKRTQAPRVHEPKLIRTPSQNLSPPNRRNHRLTIQEIITHHANLFRS
jgi:hypothetical protein